MAHKHVVVNASDKFKFIKACQSNSVTPAVRELFDTWYRDTEPLVDLGDGATPLMIAVNTGALTLVRCLLNDYNVNVNTKDDHGDTALHWAAYNGLKGVCVELVERDANCFVTNNDGKTPLQVADGDDVIEYLQAGYNPENDDRLTHSDVGSVGLSSWMETSSQGTVDPMGFEVHGSFTFAEHEYLDRASSCASLYSMDSGESTPRDSPSKAKACMLGSAIGDALGATLEGCPNRDPYRPVVTDIVGGGSFHLVPGQWTDDTSMMLCLAQSLAHRKGMNLRDQLRRYWRWCSKGENSSTGKAFSVGATTLKALKKFAHSGSNSGHCGSKAPNTAGNGSLMRIAPIPVVANSLERAMEWGAEQSKTTHGTREAVEACSAFSGMVHRALAGEDKENILNCPEILNGRWSPKIKKVIEGSYREREPPDIKGTRYVVNTLEAVLWAFYKSETFTDGMILVVNLGNDADTTGAIYGALAGAYYDLEAIPKHWRDIVYWSDHIQSVAERLYKLRSRVK